jgi:acetyl esterase/lipase
MICTRPCRCNTNLLSSIEDRYHGITRQAGAAPRRAVDPAGMETQLPVDPQIQVLLDRATGVPTTHTLAVAAARTQYEGRVALMAPPAKIAGLREQTIEGPGGPLRIRLYTPRGTGPFPLLVFFHGSGFVLCSLDTHDGMCRNLCAGAGCIVASVDYRLGARAQVPGRHRRLPARDPLGRGARRRTRRRCEAHRGWRR